MLGDLENSFLRRLKHLDDLEFSLMRIPERLTGRRDQLSKRGLFTNQPRVLGRVRGGGHALRKMDEIVHTADFIEQ